MSMMMYNEITVRIPIEKKGGRQMENEDIKLLCDWFEKHKDHKLNFIEKEAIKIAVSRASTIGDLLKAALKLLK